MGSENTGPKDDNENVGSIEARHSVGKKGLCKPGPILNSWLFPCAETAAKTTNPAGIPASDRIADCMNGCALMKSPSDASVDFVTSTGEFPDEPETPARNQPCVPHWRFGVL